MVNIIPADALAAFASRASEAIILAQDSGICQLRHYKG